MLSPSTDHKDLTVVLTGDQFFIPTNSEYNAEPSEPNGCYMPFLPGIIEHAHTVFFCHIQMNIDAHIFVVILWAY